MFLALSVLLTALCKDAMGEVDRKVVGEWEWRNIHTAPVSNMMSAAPRSQYNSASGLGSVSEIVY